jgi:transposase-like protein
MQAGHVVFLCHRIGSRAATLTRVVEELLPDADHNTEQYANYRVENDHGRLKRGCGPCAA